MVHRKLKLFLNIQDGGQLYSPKIPLFCRFQINIFKSCYKKSVTLEITRRSRKSKILKNPMITTD